MHWTKVRILGMVLWLGFCLTGEHVLAQKPAVDIRTFVTRHYQHGIPYVEARTYGRDTVPTLVSMLADDSLQAYWNGIVGTLAYIGDTTAIDPLLTFLDRQQGEINVHAFLAVLSVPQALGHLAQDGNTKAIETLVRFAQVDERPKTDFDFRYRNYQGASMRKVMGEIAVLGLGISGRQEALSFLNALNQSVQAGNLDASWQDNISEAIQLNLQIQNKGVDHVFGGQEKE